MKTEEAADDQLMDSAQWLHRRFLLNIDNFQRQLRYHRRYVSYLTHAPIQEGLCIVPQIFKRDLGQESDALTVVEQRLTALRDRTTAVLETVRVSFHKTHISRLTVSGNESQHHQTR